MIVLLLRFLEAVSGIQTLEVCHRARQGLPSVVYQLLTGLPRFHAVEQ